MTRRVGRRPSAHTRPSLMKRVVSHQVRRSFQTVDFTLVWRVPAAKARFLTLFFLGGNNPRQMECERRAPAAGERSAVSSNTVNTGSEL